MITQWMRIMAAAGLVLMTTTPTWARPAAQNGHANWKTYRSPEFGFRIDYPGTMTFYRGGPQRPPQRSMIPLCDDGTVACFEYNGHALDGTEIQALDVSVNVLRDELTASDCDGIDGNWQPIQRRTINGMSSITRKPETRQQAARAAWSHTARSIRMSVLKWRW